MCSSQNKEQKFEKLMSLTSKSTVRLCGVCTYASVKVAARPVDSTHITWLQISHYNFIGTNQVLIGETTPLPKSLDRLDILVDDWLIHDLNCMYSYVKMVQFS